jgi:hypothetical protein
MRVLFEPDYRLECLNESPMSTCAQVATRKSGSRSPPGGSTGIHFERFSGPLIANLALESQGGAHGAAYAHIIQ